MIPYVKGRVAVQAHVGVPEGTFEEEYAREGFFGRYAHLYRRHAPVGWTAIQGDLRPRAFDANPLFASGEGGPRREIILENGDVEIAFVVMDRPAPYYYRNADGDELYFVHKGDGCLETDFGPLQYAPGDYLVVPRGTAHRFVPERATVLLETLAFSEYRLPEKGMLGQHALFDPAVIRVPEPAAPSADAPRELRIRRAGELTRVTYPYCPLDVVGWKGTLTVWQLNVRDIRPVLSDQYHLPPSAHTTFVANGFVVCTFLPRPLENGDPRAMRVPFYHSNIDYDEVLFYHAGDFFSRTGIRPGMLTFHPQGIHHGPQPGAIARTEGVSRTNEIAVMIDTRRPLRHAAAANGIEVQDYWRSWRNPEVK
ncbi:MAG: homogentisate 1,2-dioxygenase [Bdellovibrionales bacterium]|nr:homogentisate 1,2-dioxygenase [Bdellovibrionales bacterium]